jgi:uncharacterized membrane-anchored protein
MSCVDGVTASLTTRTLRDYSHPGGRRAALGKLPVDMTHRAITLALMIAGSILLLALMLVSGIAAMGRQGLIALLVVVVAAAAAGIAFSWKRYYPKR